MPLYVYHCDGCMADVEIRHPMAAVGAHHRCPDCGRLLHRRLTPTHHWWPSNFRPGNENSGQRMFLDAGNQAKWADELEETKANGGMRPEQRARANRAHEMEMEERKRAGEEV